MKINHNKYLVITTLAMATLGISGTVVNHYPTLVNAASKHVKKTNAYDQAASMAAKVSAMSVAASSDFVAFSNAKLTIDADYAQAKQALQNDHTNAAQTHFNSAATYSQAVSSAAVAASSANSQFASLVSVANGYKNNSTNGNLKEAQNNFKYAQGLLNKLATWTHQAVSYAKQTHGSFNTGSGNTDTATPELSAAQSKLRKAEKKLKHAKSKKAKQAAQKMVKKAKAAVKAAEEY